MAHHRWFIIAFSLAVLVIASIAVLSDRSVTESATQPGVLSQEAGRGFKDPKLSYDLVALANATSVGLPKGVAGARTAGTLRITPLGEVQVYVYVDDVDELDGFASLDVTVERVDEDAGIVQALVPITNLRSLAALASVRSVRPPDYPVAHAGSIQSEGDAVLKSDQVRASLNVDGSGVTIGVISNGVGGIDASQASNDLPEDVDTSTCNVFGGDPAAAGAEGTAMLEIVHDIAPGAELMFGNFGFGTGLDFNAAVDCLSANADIVVDDIGWFGVGPYDGTSLISGNTSDALNGPGPIRGYFTAVGNQAHDHYQEPYAPSATVLTGLDTEPLQPPENTWVLHEFDATGGEKGTKHANAVAAPADFNRVVLPPDSFLTLILVWDDPWGTAPNDYDLFIREEGVIYFCSGEFQAVEEAPLSLPVEACSWENFGPGDLELDIMIGNFNGEAAPVEFDMFLLCDNCLDLGNGNTFDFNTAGSSVANQSDAGGSPASVISVGAVDQADPSNIQSYSSRGLTEDDRIKPDIVGPDGVCITGAGGFGQLSCQGSGKRFYGTSAAAPHAAAVAALLLECDPAMSRVELYERMVLTAIDLGGSSPNNVYGHGRLNAQAAADGCAGEPAATTTPTPSVTTTFTLSPTPTAPPTPTPVPVRVGDANCDDAVNALDAALILQFSAGLLGALPCPVGADANVDGVVDPVDSALVLQLAAGLLSSLPP